MRRGSVEEAKRMSPGVPANTCPYVDEAIRMLAELQDAYDNVSNTGEVEPLMSNRIQLAQDTLEYVREANEVLRNNSHYWYNKFKTLKERKK
jgi:hypothetical protein